MLARLRLIPQDDRFFDLFNRSADNTLEGARLLHDLLESYVDVDRKARHLKDTQEIHRLENEGDDLLADAVAALYDGVTEVPQLIRAMRWGDIYQLLEDTADKAEQVATALSNIVLKHA